MNLNCVLFYFNVFVSFQTHFKRWSSIQTLSLPKLPNWWVVITMMQMCIVKLSAAHMRILQALDTFLIWVWSCTSIEYTVFPRHMICRFAYTFPSLLFIYCSFVFGKLVMQRSQDFFPHIVNYSLYWKYFRMKVVDLDRQIYSTRAHWLFFVACENILPSVYVYGFHSFKEGVIIFLKKHY